MKALLTVSCLLVATAIFATPIEQNIANHIIPHHQDDFTVCCRQNGELQPIYLRSASPEKAPSFTEMTILDLDLSSIMKAQAIAERILYGDADVVHMKNTSFQTASHLYEYLQQNYAHFIYAPSNNNGSFIASKYPLSKAQITLTEHENGVFQDTLEFFINGGDTCCARICPNDLSMEVVNLSADDSIKTTPIFLVDLPGALTIVNQQFSPLQLAQKVDLYAMNSFHIFPVRGSRDRDRDNNDRGGYSTEVEIGHSWGGKEGGHWEGSARFEAHDNRGNYVEGEVKQNDQGEGSIKARGGHEDN